MLENILLGIQGACTVMNLLYMVAGLVIGIIFGALPGFSATMGVAVFVPFSYVMEPGAALLFLSATPVSGAERILKALRLEERLTKDSLLVTGEGKIDTSHLPYEIWPAGKAAEAFEYQSRKGMDCFKILFDWRDL